MKFFIQIFTIYMFCLSFAPCEERGGEVELFDLLVNQKTLVVEQDSNSGNNTTPCSPFCICSNCVPILYMPESGVVLLNEKNVIEGSFSCMTLQAYCGILDSLIIE